jgi:hypothetical protein
MCHSTVLRRSSAALLALAALALAGCGRAGANDPDDAQAVLRAALDAWAAGRTLDEAGRETGIVLADPRWQAGDRLVRYEIAAETRPAGFDLTCTADLTFETSKGKPARELATYTVSTRPRRTVIRSPFDAPPARRPGR